MKKNVKNLKVCFNVRSIDTNKQEDSYYGTTNIVKKT